MENSFDLGKFLNNNAKNHKIKPVQFVSVAGGIKKRLEQSMKHSKTTRLSVFDTARELNAPANENPVPLTKSQLKAEHRKLQLDKWKEEKEKKKKEVASQKKKPFLTGIAKAPLKFEPPPPVPNKPSSSGRVTRSQTRTKSEQVATQKFSFAPKNAGFNPPKLKNVPTLSLSVPSRPKKAVSITFAPVIPSNKTESGRSKTELSLKNVTEKQASKNRAQNHKAVKPKPQPPPAAITTRSRKQPEKLPSQSSSSGSDVEAKKPLKRIKTPYKRTDSKKPLNNETKELRVRLVKLQNSTESSNNDADCSKVVMEPSRTSIKEFNLDNVDVISSESDVFPVCNIKGRKSVKPNNDTFVMSSNSDETTSTIVSKPLTPKDKLVPKSESGSEEKLRSPKSPKQMVDMPMTPTEVEMAIMCPGVTMSRGKDKARKEIKWKIDEGYLNLNEILHDDGVEHFRSQLSFETKRLTEICDSWDNFSKQNVLPDQAQECILSAVGQGRLLMSQKFQQFASLIECSGRLDDGRVTVEDLHGFWDMVYIQVKNVDMRFNKLEEMRSRNWAEERAAKVAKKTAKAKTKKIAKPAGQSRIKEMIAAARAAANKQVVPAANASPSKTFHAGFFSISSPVRESSPRVHTPNNKGGLLKAVLSSEAKKVAFKQNVTPFVMVRAAITGKDVHCDGIEPLPQTPQLTPVNLFATPARSILKSANSETKSGKKSIKTVLFNSLDRAGLNQSLSSDTSIVTTSENYETANETTKDNDIGQDKDNLRDISLSEGSAVRNRRQKKFTNKDIEDKHTVKDKDQDISLSLLEGSTVRTRTQRKLADNDVEDQNIVKDKENLQQTSLLEATPVRTRRQRKSQEINNVSNNNNNEEVEVKTPRRSSRIKATDSKKVDSPQDSAKKSAERVQKRRSSRKKALQDIEANVLNS